MALSQVSHSLRNLCARSVNFYNINTLAESFAYSRIITSMVYRRRHVVIIMIILIVWKTSTLQRSQTEFRLRYYLLGTERDPGKIPPDKMPQ